jgi:hypothetical protein
MALVHSRTLSKANWFSVKFRIEDAILKRKVLMERARDGDKTESQQGLHTLAFNRVSHSQTRLLGFLPLACFLAQALHYWQINELGHMLWMCNIGNLVLAIGLFLRQPMLIRVAVMWMVPGLVVWCVYVVPTWGMLLKGQYNLSQFFGVISSTLAHLGGLSVGLIVLRKIGMDGRAWLYAFSWFFVMQIFSRWLTAPAMNVNLSQRIQDGFEGAFTSYWKFWLVLTLVVGLSAWLLAFLFQQVWPSKEV